MLKENVRPPLKFCLKNNSPPPSKKLAKKNRREKKSHKKILQKKIAIKGRFSKKRFAKNELFDKKKDLLETKF